MRPCHTANSKDDKPVSAQLALQHIKIDIVEQPMELLCKGVFLTTNITKKTNFHCRKSMNAGVQRMTQI